jgi:hypothetical protein
MHGESITIYILLCFYKPDYFSISYVERGLRFKTALIFTVQWQEASYPYEPMEHNKTNSNLFSHFRNVFVKIKK